MNLMHMKYALVVAETKSINKAAEELYVGAPALSRAIKELETSLGVSLFERSSKGMFLTPEGKTFVQYATKALEQIDDIELMLKNAHVEKQRFSLSAPRASYISTAFVNYAKTFTNSDNVSLLYMETNCNRTIANVFQKRYNLGILRYAEMHSARYDDMAQEKNFITQDISSFRNNLLISKNSKLNNLKTIYLSDLKEFVEIAHHDPYVPSLPTSEVKREELPKYTHNRIYVFERGSQFELLTKDPRTFILSSPIPKETLDLYGLVERKIEDYDKVYKDVLIYRDDYQLSKLDTKFIDELMKVKNEVID